jgi:hypothetical protein
MHDKMYIEELKALDTHLRKRLTLKEAINIIGGGRYKSEISFYGWHCLSFKLQRRTLDLVIDNECHSMEFLQALLILTTLFQNP